MTAARDANLQTLRLKYNAALAAHQGCARALTEAMMAGTTPAAALIEREAKAREALNLARERLLAAMTESITGDGLAVEPPQRESPPTRRPPEDDA